MSGITGPRIMIGATVRTAIALLVGVLVLAGAAQAKHGHRHWHAHHHTVVAMAKLVELRPITLGSMRYYGGPKSPMWRGPAEN
jgi:hypothetical protein